VFLKEASVFDWRSVAWALLMFICSIQSFPLCADVQILEDIQRLSDDSMAGRKTATTGAELARQYIQQRFTELELQPLQADFRHSFTYSSGFSHKTGVNLIALLPGCAFAEFYIVLTAHYDHLGTQNGKIYNGADDNASGVAAMLALAALLKKQPCLQYSYLFVATDAEESGLYGAKAFLAEPAVPLQQVILNINLDMVSRGERRDLLYLYGAASLPGIAGYLKSETFALALKLRHRSQGLRGHSRLDWANASDHAPFKKAGIPFLFFGVDTHSHYHSPEDDWQNIRPEYLQRMFQSLSKIVLWLDKQPPDWYQAAQKRK
jgi:Zn-dependent M28 family amino/carboxypeptidase